MVTTTKGNAVVVTLYMADNDSIPFGGCYHLHGEPSAQTHADNLLVMF